MNHTLKNKTIKDGSFVGSTDLTDVKAEELSVLGPLKFNNLTVTGDSDIMGSVRESQNGMFRDISVLGVFEAKHIICTTLDVAGSIKVAGLTVKEEANILGTLEVKTSTDPKFPNELQNLNVFAETTILEDTTINGNITIQPTLKNKALQWVKQDSMQILHLRGETIVKGNINFISGKGEIKRSSRVTIEGGIMGATIREN